MQKGEGLHCTTAARKDQPQTAVPGKHQSRAAVEARKRPGVQLRRDKIEIAGVAKGGTALDTPMPTNDPRWTTRTKWQRPGIPR